MVGVLGVRPLSRLLPRQVHRKRCSLSGRTLHGNLAAAEFHNAPRERQTQAVALGGVGGIALVELFKHPGLRMLDKSMCPIDFTKTAQQVHNQVRGLHPWPVATTEIQGKRFKVHATAVIEKAHHAEPGTLLGLTKTGLQIACGENVIEIRQLQAEGGKRMAAPDYFRGHPLEV